ncbi:MAG: hypothetical protein ACP5RI_03225 [Candidatus Micrarchaeia archaeon]
MRESNNKITNNKYALYLKNKKINYQYISLTEEKHIIIFSTFNLNNIIKIVNCIKFCSKHSFNNFAHFFSMTRFNQWSLDYVALI